MRLTSKAADFASIIFSIAFAIRRAPGRPCPPPAPCGGRSAGFSWGRAKQIHRRIAWEPSFGRVFIQGGPFLSFQTFFHPAKNGLGLISEGKEQSTGRRTPARKRGRPQDSPTDNP